MAELSAVFELADEYVAARIELDPAEATDLGVPGYDHLLPDYSPAGHDARARLDETYLERIRQIADEDVLGEEDRVAAEFMIERIETRLLLHSTGELLRHLSVISSPMSAIRDTFTMMPVDTDDQWRNVALRLRAVPQALNSARESLALGLETGKPASQRQARGVAESCAEVRGWFTEFVKQYSGVSELAEELASAALQAEAAYAQVSEWLSDEYAPKADPADGVGPERYRVLARLWLGADLDAVEAYQWGWQELARIQTRANELAEQILPGSSLADVTGFLDHDERYLIHGEANLREWLQDFTDEAFAEVNRSCFDIPDEISRCEAMIAPPGGAAAMYYTPPSEDLTRPGRTWYPTLGRTSFAIWPMVATWYHESVPGHHLQLGYTLMQRERLSRVQRIGWIAGHGEGWALYAERLMGELGFYDEPAYEFGMLAGQALRAARVVIDIGLHLHLDLPDGRPWTRDIAVDFLISEAMQEPYFAESEVDRYLGWPAQAISYKLGERAWLKARDDARSTHGEDFDLRAWHMKALALGPVGLDALARELI